MPRDVQSEESKALDQVEHNSDASAKRVSLRAQDPVSGNWVNIAAVDNGDGTYGLSFSDTNSNTPSTSVVTSVNDTASSTTLLSSSPLRLEAIIQNDSSSTLYVKFGATASSTDYSVKLYQDDILRTSYTGRIDGIWSSDGTGAAKITSLTA